MNELKYCPVCEQPTYTFTLIDDTKVCSGCRVDRSQFIGTNREDYLLKVKATFIFLAVLACVILILYLIFEKLFS